MNTNWDYAKLSVLAKENGGPEQLVAKLIKSGFDAGIESGRKDMVPIVFLSCGATAVTTLLISKVVKFFKKKEKISPEALEEAKNELIQGIKDYDAAHPDEPSATEEKGQTEQE